MKTAVSSGQASQQAAGRIIYLDLLRIAACIAVIMVHVSADNWYSLSPADPRWQVLNAYDSVAHFCVPAFFMISGTTFLNAGKELPLGVLYKKYVLRIVVAYLFWSLVYAIAGYAASGEALAFPAALAYILQATLESHYHLWFLPVIAGMYILAPLLRQIVLKPETEKYFLILFLVFGVCIPTLQLFDIPYAWALQSIIVMEIVTGYAGYFMLGHYLHLRDVSKRFRLASYALGACGFIACIVVSQVYSLEAGEPVAKLYGYTTLSSLLSVAAVFLFFKYCVSKWKWAVKHRRFIQGLSSCTFGAYLIHDFFLSALYESGVHSLAFNTIAAVPLITFAIFILSIGSSWLIRRIPVIHKYIT